MGLHTALERELWRRRSNHEGAIRYPGDGLVGMGYCRSLTHRDHGSDGGPTVPDHHDDPEGSYTYKPPRVLRTMADLP